MYVEVYETLFTKENITLFIAIWGAILSTYKILSDRLKNIRKIKVKVHYALVGQGQGVSPIMISITAVNIGNRDVTLNSSGFILPNKEHLVFVKSNVPFPYVLSESRDCCILKEQEELFEELKKHGFSGMIKVRGFYACATGEIFRSEPFTLDLEHLAK